jgi:hypothetical protein
MRSLTLFCIRIIRGPEIQRRAAVVEHYLERVASMAFKLQGSLGGGDNAAELVNGDVALPQLPSHIGG